MLMFLIGNKYSYISIIKTNYQRINFKVIIIYMLKAHFCYHSRYKIHIIERCCNEAISHYSSVILDFLIQKKNAILKRKCTFAKLMREK